MKLGVFSPEQKFGGKRGVRGAECGKCEVWKMGVWKMRSVESAESGK